MKTNLISWRDVALTHVSGIPATPEQRAMALTEYRDHGSIGKFWLGTPDEVDATDDIDELCSMGPSVGDIDWSGLPELAWHPSQSVVSPQRTHVLTMPFAGHLEQRCVRTALLRRVR